MNDYSNSMGLSGDAEQALLKLALRFELLTGAKLNWRKNSEAVETTLALAESHSDVELRETVRRLRALLSGAQQERIGPSVNDTEKNILEEVKRKKRTYRGVS